MAFENVDVISLNRELNLYKEKLRCTNINSMKSILSNSNVWNCEAKKKFNEAFKELYDVEYKDLEKKIDEYINVLQKIEKYIVKQSELKEAKNEYENLKTSINSTLSTSTIITMNTNIQNLKKKIDNCENEMSLLLTEIKIDIK